MLISHSVVSFCQEVATILSFRDGGNMYWKGKRYVTECRVEKGLKVDDTMMFITVQSCEK